MQSTEIGSLAKALSKARNEFAHIEKTAEVAVRLNSGGQYKFKYAPLEEIFKKITPALSKNGLSFFQTIKTEGGNQIITRVIHESGQWIETSLPYGNHPPDPQKLGGLITYMKRYAICMTFGIQADDDNDANDVSDRTNTFEVKNKPTRPEPVRIDNYGDPNTRVELTKEIRNYLVKLSEDMDAIQKADLMTMTLGISKFSELDSWPIKKMRDAKNKLALKVEVPELMKKNKTAKSPKFRID